MQLTRIPEYFNFWEGKPLLQRDFGVKVHKRKQWQRPKSDYGTRTKKDNNTKGQGSGLGNSGLETLVERDDSSTLGSDAGTRRGSRDFGSLGQDKGAGDQGKTNVTSDNDSSRLSVSGKGLDSGSASRRGSRDFGGKGKSDKPKKLRYKMTVFVMTFW